MIRIRRTININNNKNKKTYANKSSNNTNDQKLKDSLMVMIRDHYNKRITNV